MIHLHNRYSVWIPTIDGCLEGISLMFAAENGCYCCRAVPASTLSFQAALLAMLSKTRIITPWILQPCKNWISWQHRSQTLILGMNSPNSPQICMCAAEKNTIKQPQCVVFSGVIEARSQGDWLSKGLSCGPPVLCRTADSIFMN